MENAGYIALSRQLSLRRELDVVANNMANMNTPAYKAERMVFVEYLAQPTQQDKLSFVQDYGLARDTSEGPLTPTDNPLDVAISGSGYFTVETPLGPRYTRHGRFEIDTENRLVTGEGHPVLSTAGAPIVIPRDSGEITISSDGTVSATTPTTARQLGRIGVVTFQNEQDMKRNANSLYSTDEPPQPAERAKLAQGMLEQSNVQPILETTRMIEVLRQYQSAGRFLQSEHERGMRAIDRLARTHGG